MKHTKMLLVMLFPTAHLYSTVTWEGATSSQSQNDLTIISVVDQNLVINGDVELPFGSSIAITANNQDVDVYFNGGPNPADTTIRANDNGDLSNPTVFTLAVNAGHEIRFHINASNVRFRGTNDQSAIPLILLARGNGGGSGRIKFVFEQDHKTLQFTARTKAGGSGGCKFYIQRTAANGAPQVMFETPFSSNKVIIGGNGSLLGMQVGGLTNAIYDGFLFNGEGAPGNNSTLVVNAFGGFGLQTTT